MPKYQMDKSGQVDEPKWKRPPMITVGRSLLWCDLDPFTQAYIEAAFWTSEAPEVSTEELNATEDHNEGSIPGDVGFRDLAPETLIKIMADCTAFQDGRAWQDFMEACEDVDEPQGGHDFWLTRNGHGSGFWDRELPAPYGGFTGTLTTAAKAFHKCDLYLGDDGKVYLS